MRVCNGNKFFQQNMAFSEQVFCAAE